MNTFFLFLILLIGITLITSSSFQLSSNANDAKSLLNFDTVQYAYAEDDDGGGDEGGDDKDDEGGDDKDDEGGDDKDDEGGDDKDDDKDKNEEKDDNDEKDEDSENKESNDNNDSSNESNDESNEDSKDEQTESQTDVSDGTKASDVEQTAETQESDVSSVSAFSNEETSAPQEDLTPKEATTSQTISPQQTETPSLATSTDKVQTPTALTDGITETPDSDPEINEAKAQEASDTIIENLIPKGKLPDDIPAHINTALSDQELTKTIEEVGLEMLFVFENIQEKQIFEKIIEKDPTINKIYADILAKTFADKLRKIAGDDWNKKINFIINNINDKGETTFIDTELVVNKSSGGKSSESKKDNNNKQDLDCDDIGKKNIKVSAGDPGNLDGDGDGIGCESNGDDDNKNYHYTKKIIKYQGNKCTTESGSIPLKGKIPPKYPILLGDFYPCELKDGRATMNLPNTQNLQFALIHLDKKNGNHEAVLVNPQKIQNLGFNSALFVVKFDDQFQGQDPITGQNKTIKDVNAMALYNKSKKTIDFENGNGLAVFTILKS